MATFFFKTNYYQEIMLKRIFFLMIFFVSQTMASVFTHEEVQILKKHFLNNFQTNGAIVASPSQYNPNYYYDWIRDSAIAMGLVETWYEASQSARYKKLLLEYVSWTEKIQHQADPIAGQDILGEPKFYINGNPFDGEWGRPQNDGPALRASVLIRFAQQLLDHNEIDYVKSHLYNNTMDPQSMGTIKMDLEYIAHHWQDANFDLWEEVYGHHFFTAMAQQKALTDGAILAHQLHDRQAAVFYEMQANLINSRLKQHLDHQNKIIQATLLPHPGPQKTLELDSSVMLGILINPQKEGVFAPHHTFVQNTAKALHEQFNLMFPINKNRSGAILFGRYPGDTYDGYQTNSIGNPWFILTATMAEYYFTMAHNLSPNSINKLHIQNYLKKGDNYLRLIKQYGPDLNLSEQINLNTGVQQGATSLTWSYVSVLRAIHLREQLENRIKTTGWNTY
ncbi:TPA: Dot/Icm T4SS effector LegY [Legionella pneumophila]|uniref:glucan 1,4-alpha-glucosidase n=2 Tax=Legionella pneumophila TaxID=446 RepID=Q5ZYF0_LEGPH|nr:Dot/Icm T4SS effector LegY [Legionella pneumophila]AAU26519.1 glucoamylase [Legionella pneumophila subsp. pneumophila str. Philadelphia 1]AEW50703.1 glucoamylase [Legionella pneumophila subsp. pneumophila ATCC 43290]MCK0182270.1 Dot/Icm T4SS effector LegY [Legionella pneumophila]MCK1870963.1 Dot/Icm T4SS effector LegY [Legionella pneumophila]MCK1888710.1 Dot/Icm T4SS effector LegY [Legionella pneumophila]